MELIFLLGRVLFGGFFMMNGIQHFTKLQNMVGYTKSKNVSSPTLAVSLSGALLLIGGAGILFNVYLEWATLALVFFLVPVTFKMHNFWAVSDPQMKMMDKVQFFKNMALLGAVLMILALTQP